MARNGKNSDLPKRYTEAWLEGLDGRTRLAQAVRARADALMADLGGEDALSYQQRSLCRRAIWMEAVIEQQEAALARGEDIDQGKLTQAVNSLIGLLKTLGLERRAREVPDLQSFIRQRAEKESQQ